MLIEKYREGQKRASFCIRGPRESLRQGFKRRVVVCGKIGLHQGSALSPFLFAMIMDRLTDEVRREPQCTMLFADNIMIFEETREEVKGRLECWRYALKRREMKVGQKPNICA